MSTVIVDASVAVKWVLRKTDSDKARAVAASPSRLLAPDLIVLEIANALRIAVLAGSIPHKDATQSISGIRRIFNPLVDTSDMIDEAMAIAIEYRHPIYDCLYIVTSRRLDAPLVTADAKFVAKLAGTPDADRVILLADWK